MCKKRFLLLLILFWWIIPNVSAQSPADSLPSSDPDLPQASEVADSTDGAALKPLVDTMEAVLLPDSLMRASENRKTGDTSDLEVPVRDTVGEVEVGTSADADKRTLRGTVYESDGTTPLPGAVIGWVVNEGGLQSDLEGRFELPYQEGDTLLVTALGFGDMRVPVQGGMNDLKITLKQVSTEISEVVVTALGIERDTRTLSYDVQQLEGSDLTEVRDPNGNAMNNLAGKVSGLTITPAAGGVGSATRVVLRGNRSIRDNNNALMIIDGVPVNNTYGAQASDENGGYNGGSSSQNINPEDIESMSVLKGQSAAALYGGDAQDGALIVNTKSGRPGPLEINYSGGVSFQVPQLLMRFQNTYGRGSGGVYSPNAGFSWGAPAQTYKDNVKDFFNTTTLQTNSINLSGGSESVQAYGSYSNSFGNGVLGHNKLQSHNFNVRLTGRFMDRLSADFKVTYFKQDIKNHPKVGELGTAMYAYLMPRDMSPAELNHYEDFDEVNQPYPAPWPTGQPSVYTNPYWYVNRTAHDTRRNRAMLLGKLKYDIRPWLNIQARYSLDFIDDNTAGRFYANTILPLHPGGRYYENRVQRYYSYFDLLVNGENTFGDFSLSYTLGGAFDDVKAKSVNASANGLQLPNLFILQNAISPVISSSESQVQTQGLFATAQVGYKDYLFLEGTFRNDWSSTLPKPHSYLYPSVGLTAILSDMVKMPDWVNFAKIRGTYAYVGNDAPSYIIHQDYTFGPGTGGGYLWRDAAKAIEDLKPEQTTAFELGTDWKFLDHRLGLGLSVYQTNTYNQLVPISRPVASGFSTEWVNLGDIQNQGLEVFLTGIPLRKGDFSWTSTLVFSKNINKVNRLSEELKETRVSSGSDRLGAIGVREGGAYGDIYGYAWKRNANGDYLVNADGLPIVESDRKLGNFNPDFMLGWSNEFRYKNFSLRFQIDGRVGGQVISGTDAYLAYYGLSDYTTAFRDGGLVLDAVHEDGSKNTTAISAEKFWTNVSDGRSARAQFFLYDATNFRLRSLALGYTFFIDKPYLKSAHISVVGNNLFFFYRGRAVLDLPGMPERKIPVDPEAGLGAGNMQGLESGVLPMTRGVGLNVRLTF